MITPHDRLSKTESKNKRKEYLRSLKDLQRSVKCASKNFICVYIACESSNKLDVNIFQIGFTIWNVENGIMISHDIIITDFSGGNIGPNFEKFNYGSTEYRRQNDAKTLIEDAIRDLDPKSVELVIFGNDQISALKSDLLNSRRRRDAQKLFRTASNLLKGKISLRYALDWVGIPIEVDSNPGNLSRLTMLLLQKLVPM